MSDMRGNPHYWNLERGYATDTPEYAATCQIEAALALAYEQRTANLLALYNSAHSEGIVQGSEFDALKQQIRNRFGFTND